MDFSERGGMRKIDERSKKNMLKIIENR